MTTHISNHRLQSPRGYDCARFVTITYIPTVYIYIRTPVPLVTDWPDE